MTDPSDAEFIATITAALVGMIRAVNRDDGEAATGELSKLLHAIVDHKKAMSEPPGNEALRRIMARL